jgi:hypothetical protein
MPNEERSIIPEAKSMVLEKQIFDLGTWTLASSSGREELKGIFLDELAPRSANELPVDLWLGAKSYLSDQYPLEPAYEFILHRMLFSRTAVEELISDLAQWLAKPKNIERDLPIDGGRQDQKFRIELRIPRNLTSPLERPVCTLSWSWQSFRLGQCSFVVDQSCIRIFRDSLSVALARL